MFGTVAVDAGGEGAERAGEDPAVGFAVEGLKNGGRVAFAGVALAGPAALAALAVGGVLEFLVVSACPMSATRCD